MMKCTRCKNCEIREEDNYCSICGLDLKEATAVTAAPTVVNNFISTNDVNQDAQKISRELRQKIKSLSVEW